MISSLYTEKKVSHTQGLIFSVRFFFFDLHEILNFINVKNRVLDYKPKRKCSKGSLNLILIFRDSEFENYLFHEANFKIQLVLWGRYFKIYLIEFRYENKEKGDAFLNLEPN